MKKLTDDLIDSAHHEIWEAMRAEHEKTHKEYWKYRIPQDELNRASEYVRALYCLQQWQKEGSSQNPLVYLNHYMVNSEVAIEVVVKYVGEKSVVKKENLVKPQKRASKWGAFMDWAKQNEGKTFTTEQLVKKSGFSYQTTLNFVNSTPEFIKVKRGSYKISVARRD